MNAKEREEMVSNGMAYMAATNPFLAVRIAGGPRLPWSGYPEVLQWKAEPILEIKGLQEDIYRVIIGLPKNLADVIRARFGEEITLEAYGERIGRSRERVRQLEARALRIMRSRLVKFHRAIWEATEVVPIPGGALDPDWMTTKQAALVTGYTHDYIRVLCRQGKVVSQINPIRRSCLQVSKASLRRYVEQRPGDGRKKGKWKEANHGQT